MLVTSSLNKRALADYMGGLSAIRFSGLVRPRPSDLPPPLETATQSEEMQVSAETGSEGVVATSTVVLAPLHPINPGMQVLQAEGVCDARAPAGRSAQAAVSAETDQPAAGFAFPFFFSFNDVILPDFISLTFRNVVGPRSTITRSGSS
jgi:hypothetical protein